MKIIAFACGMLLIIAGVMFIVTSYTLYEGGTAGAGSMFLFGLGIFIAGKFINHASGTIQAPSSDLFGPCTKTQTRQQAGHIFFLTMIKGPSHGSGARVKSKILRTVVRSA